MKRISDRKISFKSYFESNMQSAITIGVIVGIGAMLKGIFISQITVRFDGIQFTGNSAIVLSFFVCIINIIMIGFAVMLVTYFPSVCIWRFLRRFSVFRKIESAHFDVEYDSCREKYEKEYK